MLNPEKTPFVNFSLVPVGMTSYTLALISITGRDRPGITAALMRTLASFDVNVLDIGQAVIHDALSLGVLVAIPDSSGSVESIRMSVEQTITALGDLHVHFAEISHASYAHWVDQQGKPRHIITLLARRITACHLSRLASIIAARGLNIFTITRLSGRIPLEVIGERGQTCVQFAIQGPVADLPAFRCELMELANELGIDVAYQEDNVFRRHRRLLVLDMDSTLIRQEVIDELAQRAGVGDQVSAITERAMRGELDFKQSLLQRVALLKGLPESVLAEVADSLELTDGAEYLLRGQKARL